MPCYKQGMKRQHRSTLDRCRIYLDKRLREYFGYKARVPDQHFGIACESASLCMQGDLTFENWRIAVDRAYPI